MISKELMDEGNKKIDAVIGREIKSGKLLNMVSLHMKRMGEDVFDVFDDVTPQELQRAVLFTVVQSIARMSKRMSLDDVQDIVIKAYQYGDWRNDIQKKLDTERRRNGEDGISALARILSGRD